MSYSYIPHLQHTIYDEVKKESCTLLEQELGVLYYDASSKNVDPSQRTSEANVTFETSFMPYKGLKIYI